LRCSRLSSALLWCVQSPVGCNRCHPDRPKWIMFRGFLKVGLSLLQVWVYAIIVTEAGAYDNASADTQKYCRTDQSSVLSNSPWFRRVSHVSCIAACRLRLASELFHVSSFLVDLTRSGMLCRWPYFAQWGAPTFSWSSTLTMLAGAISAMVESV